MYFASLRPDSPGGLQPVDLDGAGFDVWNKLAAEIDGVVERIEAADEKRADAEPIIAQDRLRHLLRGADETRGIAERAGRPRDRHPQPLVMHIAFERKAHQTPPGIVDRPSHRLLPAPAFLGAFLSAALAAVPGHRRKNLVGLVPGGT